jgi:hypothetical protein
VRIGSKKAEQKDLKNLQFCQKSLFNVGANKEISTIKKKQSTLQ